MSNVPTEHSEIAKAVRIALITLTVLFFAPLAFGIVVMHPTASLLFIVAALLVRRVRSRRNR